MNSPLYSSILLAPTFIENIPIALIGSFGLIILIVALYAKKKITAEIHARLEAENRLHDLKNTPAPHDPRIETLEKENSLLKEENTQSQQIINNVRDIIWTASSDMKFTYISPSIFALRGYTPEEAMQNGFQKCGPPETIDILMDRMSATLHAALSDDGKDVEGDSVEVILYRKDGSTFYAEIIVTVLRDNDGILNGFIGVTRDITKRKNIELALEKSTSFLNTMGRTAQVGGWEVDVNTNKAIWTEEIFRLCEMPVGPAPSLDETLRFLHPEDREDISQIIDQSIIDKQSHEAELRIITEKGNDIWCRIISHPVVENGRTIKLIGTLQNITDIKKAQELKELHDARSSAILETVANAIITTDEEGIVDSVNPAATTIFGYTAEEMIGIKASVLSPDLYSRIDEAPIDPENTLAPPTIINSIRDFQGRHKDGHEFPIRLRASEVVVANKTFFMGVIQDLSHERALEQQLMQAQKIDSLGTLAGGIAHDFNNILTGIIGYLAMAKKHTPADDELMHRYLTEIEEGGKRAATLVNQILTFSRTSDIALHPLSIYSVSQDAVSFIRASIPTNIKIHADLSPACGLVMGESTHIHQLISNLCTNAHHSMEEKGHGEITISLSPITLKETTETLSGQLLAGAYVQLSVKDTGQGIAPDIFERLLDPFFTTKGVGQGTGLGLSIVHGIAKRMGAGISIESQIKEGTTVQLTIPMLKGMPEHTSQESILPEDSQRV